MKEPGPFPIHSEISGGSSSDVKDGQSRNDGKGDFSVISQPMQESDNKLIKLPGGASSVYISVDLSADSVEGNWGSVSVLSAQSDAPAYTSTEILPKSDPEEPGKSENTNLHLRNKILVRPVYLSPHLSVHWLNLEAGLTRKPLFLRSRQYRALNSQI